ncbi:MULTISPECIES: hypothetical protein [unclassified Deinococcus]|uniref:hypothetical protein n=1 Tax=unclassified Deinococcus TaxID=2623546 RepID=UPI000C1880EC|nr:MULTISPECIES: hypothetical protein [unclassified Deinococcus]MCD0162629.1 hypothetical protein [Deinococcus sp. 6YEL10]MCD0167581.1 hypothetical protein [Deinococcus sp. 12RED42]MCD0169529.1 hypothetical protein [Deinococcus sp. 23YEL01]PIG99217.1 hypothetical protein AMD26_005575 [Deinococcus sp. UR1]
MTPARWRSLALGALWVQVAALLGTAAFSLWRSADFSRYFNAAEALIAALVMAWWTTLLGRALNAQPTPGTDGVWRALSLTFPWLTSLRGALWALTLFSVLGGAAPEANPVALTALLTLWGAAIVASNATYGSLARLSSEPLAAAPRRKLMDWLNLAAPLSLGMAVMNVVPIPGFGGAPTLSTQLVYGLGGLLDVAATLLALRALRVQPVPGGEESR